MDWQGEKERKSFLDKIKNTFHSFWRAIIWWKIKIWQKIADTSFNPNYETCIYFTLLFIIKQSKKLNVIAPSITFDQPPLLKALEIITAKRLDVVPFLGRFQMLISFYGRVDTITAGLGIDKLSQNIYGENSVNICCQVR